MNAQEIINQAPIVEERAKVHAEISELYTQYLALIDQLKLACNIDAKIVIDCGKESFPLENVLPRYHEAHAELIGLVQESIAEHINSVVTEILADQTKLMKLLKS